MNIRGKLADFIEKMPFKKKPTRNWCEFTADQQIAIFKEFIETMGTVDYDSYYPVTTHTPKYDFARRSCWDKGQIRLLKDIIDKLEANDGNNN